MQRILAISIAAVAIATGLAAPAAAQEEQQILADIRMLQQQTLQLQRLLATLGEAITAVNTRLDEGSAETRKSFADQRLLIDGVATDVRVVREKLDDTGVRLSSLSQEVEALRQSMPIMPAMPGYSALPEGPAGAGGEPAPDGTPAQTPPPPPVATAGLSPQRLFDEARGDYAAGQWPLALQGFDMFLRQFPQSELAPAAQYYIGETYRLDGKDDEALAAYRTVIRNYPNSSEHVAAAYYRQGLLLEQMGQREEAIASYRYVVENYPELEPAIFAQQGLERLGG